MAAMTTNEGSVEPAPVRSLEPLRVGDPAQIHQYVLVGRFPGRHASDVFLAQAGGSVVLKIAALTPGDDPGPREQVAREVRNSKRVRSPRVARMLDSGEWQGRAYVVQEFVDGPTLDELMDARGWSALEDGDVARLATGLAEALAALREADVVHRDLTPSNVVVHAARGPVLVDFGISRTSDDHRVTQVGYARGTPGYMSPEQLRGERATAASDVFQWGLVVGHVMLGRHPVVGVMDADRRLAPEWRDALAVPTPDPALRGRLGRLVERALDPDAARRPSPAVLVEGLQATTSLRVPAATTAIPLAPPRLREARTLREAWLHSAAARQVAADTIADRWWAFAALAGLALLAGWLVGSVLALLVAGLAA